MNADWARSGPPTIDRYFSGTAFTATSSTRNQKVYSFFTPSASNGSTTAKRRPMAAYLSAGPKPSVTRREKVIEGPYVLGRGNPGFDVSRDGRIVLVREQRENGRTIVVQRWIDELRTAGRTR